MKRILPAALGLLAAMAAVSGCTRTATPSESIVLASAPFESLGLVYVAQEKRMFEDEGLRVTQRDYDAGVDALDAVVNGEADIAVGTAEFPLVGKAFKHVPVCAVANIDRPEFIYVIGRSDRGIGNPSDLEGKRIGTVAGSIAEFYLGRLLELNGMTIEDITFVDLRTPAEWRAAIVEGEVDAVVLAQPEAGLVRDTLGDNAVFFSAQESQPVYTLAIATNAWIERNPDLVERFLAALAEAEKFVADHPSEARTIIQQRLDLEPSYMESVAAQNEFALSLDQSLLTAMEDEARWMIRSKLTTETVVPDFGAYVYVDGLMAVKPGAVNIPP